MGKKRKLFLGNRPIAGTVVKSRRAARKITTEYHRKVNEIFKLKQQQRQEPTKQSTPEQDRIEELERQLAQSGGINRYQQASITSTSHFKTSRWVIRSLDQLDLLRRGKERGKLNVVVVHVLHKLF